MVFFSVSLQTNVGLHHEANGQRSKVPEFPNLTLNIRSGLSQAKTYPMLLRYLRLNEGPWNMSQSNLLFDFREQRVLGLEKYFSLSHEAVLCRPNPAVPVFAIFLCCIDHRAR